MTVSVIIPFYNLKDYVRPALESVVGASVVTGLKLEVICVDDGSTDGTSRLIDEFVSASAGTPAFDFKVLHKPNGGEGSARNAGLAAASGEWVTFLDGDDVWLKDMLVSFADAAGRHSSADIIGFRFAPFEDGAALPHPSVTHPMEMEFVMEEFIPAAAVLNLGVFPTFFRREMFSSLSFSALPLGADRLYVAECLALSKRLVMSDLVVHGYRVREGSMARAQWNERKVRSMVDFAAGSLKALVSSGKRLESGGTAYLWDVLLQVTPKQLRRMSGDASGAREHWLSTLARIDAVGMSLWQRIKRFRYLHGRR